MDRTASKKFLLYIEPELSDKSQQPINDALVSFMAIAVNSAKAGIADYAEHDNPDSDVIFREGDRWRGTHQTPCKNYSSNQDYLLHNGMVTNSLAPFYLRWYRSAIPEGEMQKFRDLHDYYVRMGLAKPIIEGLETPIFTETAKTGPSPENPGAQVPREASFEEEDTVDFADSAMTPKEEVDADDPNFELTR